MKNLDYYDNEQRDYEDVLDEFNYMDDSGEEELFLDEEEENEIHK